MTNIQHGSLLICRWKCHKKYFANIAYKALFRNLCLIKQTPLRTYSENKNQHNVYAGSSPLKCQVNYMQYVSHYSFVSTLQSSLFHTWAMEFNEALKRLWHLPLVCKIICFHSFSSHTFQAQFCLCSKDDFCYTCNAIKTECLYSFKEILHHITELFSSSLWWRNCQIVSLLSPFWKNRSRLMASSCVSLYVYPLLIYSESLNKPSWNLVCISCYMKPFQWHKFILPPISNTNITASETVAVITLMLLKCLNWFSWSPVYISGYPCPFQPSSCLSNLICVCHF